MWGNIEPSKLVIKTDIVCLENKKSKYSVLYALYWRSRSILSGQRCNKTSLYQFWERQWYAHLSKKQLNFKYILWHQMFSYIKERCCVFLVSGAPVVDPDHWGKALGHSSVTNSGKKYLNSVWINCHYNFWLVTYIFVILGGVWCCSNVLLISSIKYVIMNISISMVKADIKQIIY